MNDEADVALVDPEPERVCRDHGLESIGHESVLHVLPVGCRHLAVVKPNGHVTAQLLVQALGLSNGRNIDNADTRAVSEQTGKRSILLALIHRAPHFEAKIRPREARDCHDGFVHAQLSSDVTTDFVGRRRRERQYRRPAESLHDRTKHQVVRTEVMPPLTDAVRLVHNEQTY